MEAAISDWAGSKREAELVMAKLRFPTWRWSFRLLAMSLAVVPLAWLFTQAITSFQHGDLGGEPVATFHFGDMRNRTFAVNPAGDQFATMSVDTVSDEASFVILTIDRTMLAEPARGQNNVVHRSKMSHYENDTHRDIVCDTDRSGVRLAAPSEPSWSCPDDFEFEISRDGRQLAAYYRGDEGEENSGILHWDLKAPDHVHRFPVGFVAAIAFTGDSRRLAFAARSGECGLFDLQGRHMVSLPKEAAPCAIHNIGVSEHGDLLAIASSSGEVQVWDVAERRCVTTFRPHADHWVGALAFVANDEILLTTGDEPYFMSELLGFPPYYHLERVANAHIKSWDIRTGRCLRRWRSGFFSELRGIPGSNDFFAGNRFNYHARYALQ